MALGEPLLALIRLSREKPLRVKGTLLDGQSIKFEGVRFLLAGGQLRVYGRRGDSLEFAAFRDSVKFECKSDSKFVQYLFPQEQQV
jgi:hypothetical protein